MSEEGNSKSQLAVGGTQPREASKWLANILNTHLSSISFVMSAGRRFLIGAHASALLIDHATYFLQVAIVNGGHVVTREKESHENGKKG